MKTFLINKDGSSFCMLKYTTSSKKKEFYKSVSKMTEWTHWGFYEWYKELMNQCYEYRIWILSYHLFDPACQEDHGLICGDGSAAHLPLSYETTLLYWSTHLFTAVKGEGILPSPGQQILSQAKSDGYLLLKELA